MIKIFLLFSAAACIFFLALYVFAVLGNNKKNKKDAKRLSARFQEITSSRKRILITLILFFFVSLILSNIIFGLICAVLYFYFDWYLKNKREKERAALIDRQVIEALTIVKNALQSGQSLQQSINTASGELKEPIKSEFEKISESLALGADFDNVLKSHSETAPSKEFKMMIDTVRISKDSGASMSDVFDRIIYATTQRIMIQSKVEALTAQGRLSGNIVSIMPFIVIFIMYLLEPGMVSSLFTTFVGNVLLLIVVVMVLIGSFAIRKLTEIDF